MPRAHFLCNPTSIYHLTARTNSRIPFVSMPLVWTEMENHLFGLHHFYGVRIFSFVLMSNHFHCLANFPHANASTAMQYFMQGTSRAISQMENSENHRYGSRFHRSEITSFHYYKNAYKYVYRNPVRAGICAAPEDYPFSTLRGLVGLEKLHIPLQEDLTLFESFDSTLRWLRAPPDLQDEHAIRLALKHQVFSISKNQETGFSHHLCHDLL